MTKTSTDDIDEMLRMIDEAENDLGYQDNYNEQPPNDIVAFNELRSCSDLVRMHKDKQLIIDPDFQRDVVWSPATQTRFIDSLVKQLPIPSMCISYDYNTDTRLMIDGLQRISTIIRFLSENEWKLSDLDDIDPHISGRTVKYIREKNKNLYSRIENLTIPITVLRCDNSKKAHMEYLFTIFHRLNTQGNKLSNQEIRNCIYSGKFNSYLKEIVGLEEFRNLFGLEKNKTYRFMYEELLLRIIAHYSSYESYSGKLSSYLNEFMGKYRHVEYEQIQNEFSPVRETLHIIYNNILDGQEFQRQSKATTEALFVGIARNIEIVKNLDNASLKKKYEELRNDALFSVDALKEGLAAKDKVVNRLNRATEIFA